MNFSPRFLYQLLLLFSIAFRFPFTAVISKWMCAAVVMTNTHWQGMETRVGSRALSIPLANLSVKFQEFHQVSQKCEYFQVTAWRSIRPYIDDPVSTSGSNFDSTEFVHSSFFEEWPIEISTTSGCYNTRIWGVSELFNISLLIGTSSRILAKERNFPFRANSQVCVLNVLYWF